VAVCFLGLGNPGKEYENTRHNLGFKVIDELSRRSGIALSSTGGLVEFGRGSIMGGEVVLAKPLTFMNLSGIAASWLEQKFRFVPGDFVAVVDDFNLLLGSIRFRKRGSHGGHNGLASLIEYLGTEDFPRLRLGTGPVPAGVDPVDFVLGGFSSAEEPVVEEMVDRACESCIRLVQDGPEAVMNSVNRRQPG